MVFVWSYLIGIVVYSSSYYGWLIYTDFKIKIGHRLEREAVYSGFFWPIFAPLSAAYLLATYLKQKKQKRIREEREVHAILKEANL